MSFLVSAFVASVPALAFGINNGLTVLGVLGMALFGYKMLRSPRG